LWFFSTQQTLSFLWSKSNACTSAVATLLISLPSIPLCSTWAELAISREAGVSGGTLIAVHVEGFSRLYPGTQEQVKLPTVSWQI
jgi:hypothetical protein